MGEPLVPRLLRDGIDDLVDCRGQLESQALVRRGPGGDASLDPYGLLGQADRHPAFGLGIGEPEVAVRRRPGVVGQDLTAVHGRRPVEPERLGLGSSDPSTRLGRSGPRRTGTRRSSPCVPARLGLRSPPAYRVRRYRRRLDRPRPWTWASSGPLRLSSRTQSWRRCSRNRIGGSAGVPTPGCGGGAGTGGSSTSVGLFGGVRVRRGRWIR